MKQHPFTSFLETFVPLVESKSKQLNQAVWLLETTGSNDAAELKASLDAELRMLFHDSKTYRQLLEWDKDPALRDPILKRELKILIQVFKPNQISKELITQIAQAEADLARTYANFRPQLDGKPLSENDLREILKNENDPAIRQTAWSASKEIGEVLAPQILKLVELRNRAARSLNYSNFFDMQLELQEVDRDWLLQTFEVLSNQIGQSILEDAWPDRIIAAKTLFSKNIRPLGVERSILPGRSSRYARIGSACRWCLILFRL